MDLKKLCEIIEMPDKMTTAVLEGREEALSQHLNEALKSWDIYQQKGISKEIYIDTMKVFTRFCKEHKEMFGYYSFDREWWTHRQTSLILFRLGALEFEMKTEDKISRLSVHIPSDVVMTRKALDASYALALEFFKEYFPDYCYKEVYCDTWLLSPALEEILPPDSKIRNFRKDYDIISTNPDSKEFLMWVYQKEVDAEVDYKDLPEESSLQRNIKALLLAGGKVGNAYGRHRQGVLSGNTK